MVDLTILRRSLEEIELAKEDISPQDFDKIAGYIEKEEIGSAAEMIQTVFEDGNFDMRLVSYYLYAHFLKTGVKSFKEALPIFKALVSDHWERLRPAQRKDKQIENSFNWYFTHVINKLKYNERLFKEKKPLLWPRAALQVSEIEFSELQETLKSFSVFFNTRWAESSTTERVAHLIKKIADLKPLIVEEQEFTENVSPEPVIDESSFQEGEDASSAAAPEPSLFATAEMMSFIQKLITFEKLIEKGEFRKAAVVSADITQAIAHFDPCSYFPKLFASYFNQLARHSSSIAEESENQETLQWKSLERLYKSDIDQFISW